MAVKLRDKAKRKADKDYRKETREMKAAFRKKDLSWHHKGAQREFNKLRKMEELQWFAGRDIEPYCISCLKTNMDWCCGHYKTVGSSGGLRYDRNNTFLQCNRYCNMALSGNISGNARTIGFTKGIIHRFGTVGHAIIELCDLYQSTVKRWTCEEVEEIRLDSMRQQRIIQKLLDEA